MEETFPKEEKPASDIAGSGRKSAYLLELKLRNVRCFGPKEQTLRLSDAEGRPARWTVILGDNGVGKTTLLQCLVALEPRRHYFRNQVEEERPQVELPTGPGEVWRIYREPSRPQETSIEGQIGFASGLAVQDTWRSRTVLVPTGSWANASDAGSLKGAPKSTSVGRALEEQRLRSLRCCAYGASRRMGSTSLSRGLDDLAASLFLDDVNLVDVEEWLLVEDYARVRGLRPTELRLERIKGVLVELLPDVSDLRIRDLHSRSLKPAIEVRTPYGWVSLSDLSLGYRTMIAWTVDLASRLFQRYPESLNPLAEPAVVLVDEVDLHLHPKWQRELREHLTERFPNTQFVVTAHSPLVVQASENENIVVLRREGDHVVIDNDVETVRGWRVDQVLTSDLFGLKTARPPEYDDLIAHRNALLAKRNLDDADSALLNRLEDEISQLPAGESTEDQKAMEIIRRAAAKLGQR